MKIAVFACVAAALAAGCGGEKQETKPLPPPISLGAPEGRPSANPPPVDMPAANPHEAPAVPARFKAPEGWQSEAPSNNMTAAQFRIPRADGDDRDGKVAVFANKMGATQANIDRWRSQFSEVVQGKDSLEEITAGLKGKVTLLDITGNYAGGMGAGGAPHGGGDGGSTRMIGAVIDAADGTFYVKATGPPATIAKWEKSIREFILSTAK